MAGNKSVSLVLPCKNEEHALPVLLKSIPKAVDEIIVVDNRSIDNTVKVARSLGAITLSERRSKNGIGYGYALAKGIRSAKGDIIICMDADGSYPVKEIPKIVSYLLSRKIDFISCNRIPFKEPREMSELRFFGVLILNLIILFLFWRKIKDSLTGMWVFKKETVKDLTLFEGGWNFSLEIKLNAIRNPKIKFSEYNIPYHDRVFDSSKQNLFKTGLEHVLFLVKTKFANQKLLKELLSSSQKRVL